MKHGTAVMMVVLAALGISWAATAAFTDAQDAQGPQASAGDLVRYVPQGAEVVVCVDVQKITAHPAFSRIYQSFDTAKLDAGIAAIEQFTGINLLRDIRAALIAGEIKKDGRNVILLEGTWQKDRLVPLVASNPSYSKRDSSGLEIHSWTDNDTAKMKHAVFVRDDVLAMSDFPEVLDLVAQTAAGKAPAFPLQEVIGGDAVAGEAFVAAVRPSDPGSDIRNNPVLGRLQSLAVTLKAKESSIALSAKANADDARNAALLDPMLRGLIAFGELLDNKAGQYPWVVATTHQNSQVAATADVPLENIVGFAGVLQSMAKAK